LYHPRRPRGYYSGRCDIIGRATFLARKFISRAEEPLGTFPFQTSSRSVEIRSADWPEYFSGQSTRRSSRVILSPFYTKWFSSSIEREDSSEEFQKKKRFDEAEEIANHNMGASNTHVHQFSRRIYRRYIIKLTSVVFFLKIGINLYSKSTRFLYCYFWFARKVSGEHKLTCYFSSIFAQLLKLSTIYKSPLHGPRNYVDRTLERSANYSARTFLIPISTPTTVSRILANSPTILRFLRLSKKINPRNRQLSTSRCGSIVRKTN